MSGHNEHTLVTKVEQTINYIAKLGRDKADDLKDIIFLSLALKCVQLPESSQGRLYELHSTTRGTMAACMDQLLPLKLTNSGHQHERDDAESLAKPTHGPGGHGESAEQYLNDFARLAAEFTDFQTRSI
ncbi:hypothetical protein J4E91_005092 [Alternaria rosae]|nr:hypothetical protein J4E91_005092 [Alternaria rosae]